MRKTAWTPSIVSKENDRSVYLVADDFGKAGSACRRCDEQMRDIPFFLQEFTDHMIVIATFSCRCPCAWCDDDPSRIDRHQ